MNKDALINRLAGNATDIEMLSERVEALEMAVCFLLYQLPDDAGLRFLSRQANETEDSQKAPGVVEALDYLRELVSVLHERLGPAQSDQLKNTE